MKLFKDSELDSQIYATLSRMIVDRTYPAGTKINEKGKKAEAALYLVRSGELVSTNMNGEKETYSGGGYYGIEQLMADVKSGKNGPKDPTTITPDTTLEAKADSVVGVLELKSLRKVLNTKYLGTGRKDVVASISKSTIALKDLKKHTLLGAGTFGQVWLVSCPGASGKEEAYALKVQSKYELLKDGQAKAVVSEKNIMAMMDHPFIIRLVATYKDTDFVYMLLGLVQGGELYNVIHSNRRHGMPESEAMFYAAGIAEGLSYMHRRGFVYRDLKPENVSACSL